MAQHTLEAALVYYAPKVPERSAVLYNVADILWREEFDRYIPAFNIIELKCRSAVIPTATADLGDRTAIALRRTPDGCLCPPPPGPANIHCSSCFAK